MKFIFYLAAVLYPVLVFSCLVIFKVPIRFFSLGLLFFALFLFLSLTGSKKKTVEAERKLFFKTAFRFFRPCCS